MEDALVPLIVAAAVIGVVSLIVVGWRIEKKRRAAIQDLAARLGLNFSPDRDRELARRNGDIHGLREGENRYAFNVLSGRHRDHDVTAFDFHYETSSTDSKGNRTTSHHHRHVVLLTLERAFPDLTLAPEGLLSKFAQALGYDDIDFESHEFSRRFCVRSPDKKFAYDFCHARMIDRLLAAPGTQLQIADTRLAFLYEGKIPPDQLEARLDFAVALRALMPAYLFDT